MAQTWAQEIHKGFHYCASEPWIQSQGLQRTKPGGNLALYALNWFEPRGREAAGTPRSEHRILASLVGIGLMLIEQKGDRHDEEDSRELSQRCDRQVRQGALRQDAP